jgi:hypothetical protein
MLIYFNQPSDCGVNLKTKERKSYLELERGQIVVLCYKK